MYSDTVCVNPGQPHSCANNFGLFLMKKQKGLNGLDGILGLAPHKEGKGPSYIKTLADQGKIGQEVISFQINLANTKHPSFVTIGGTDP